MPVQLAIQTFEKSSLPEKKIAAGFGARPLIRASAAQHSTNAKRIRRAFAQNEAPSAR